MLFLQLIQLLWLQARGVCIVQEVEVSLKRNYFYVDFEVCEAYLYLDADPALEKAKMCTAW